MTDAIMLSSIGVGRWPWDYGVSDCKQGKRRVPWPRFTPQEARQYLAGYDAVLTARARATGADKTQ